jgi:hypothetical protein
MLFYKFRIIVKIKKKKKLSELSNKMSKSCQKVIKKLSKVVKKLLLDQVPTTSHLVKRRRARNISVLLANQPAKSASALVTLTHIVLPIGKHPLRLAVYQDKVSMMLTMPASRSNCRLNFQILSLIPRMPQQCLQPKVSSNAIGHQKTPRLPR